MKKSWIPKIIIALVVIVMLVPIIVDVVSSSVLKTIEFDDIENKLSETANYQFTLVYVAPSSKSDIKDAKTEVKNVAGNYTEAVSGEKLTVYYLDYDKLSSSQIYALFGDSTEKVSYMMMVNGELIKVINGELSSSELDSYVSTYSSNGVSDDLKAYKVPEDANSYSKLVKRKNTVTMAVFGRDTCFYCNQFKVVYNTVADEYDLDIYYIDSDSYDEDEYDKIMDLGLKIPASCSSTGEEIDLQPGFSTPLTLFTKNGKVIDCISGYINKQSLITKLQTVGMIEAE